MAFLTGFGTCSLRDAYKYIVFLPAKTLARSAYIRAVAIGVVVA